MNEGILLEIKSYAKMFLGSIVIIMSALSIGYYLNTHYEAFRSYVDIFEYSGYVCWGAALADDKFRSWNQSARPKVFYRRLQIIFSLTGIFCFILAKTLAS